MSGTSKAEAAAARDAIAPLVPGPNAAVLFGGGVCTVLKADNRFDRGVIGYESIGGNSIGTCRSGEPNSERLETVPTGEGDDVSSKGGRSIRSDGVEGDSSVLKVYAFAEPGPVAVDIANGGTVILRGSGGVLGPSTTGEAGLEGGVATEASCAKADRNEGTFRGALLWCIILNT